ncbi:MAG: hypothetical protein F4Y86_10165 [Gammaproteobacteria bacterium]|nr:hypothetical protein [Gammaproteobacteria bacterium]MYB38120.1 hypothetical protein [Gammaproteobacteria bacterium]
MRDVNKGLLRAARRHGPPGDSGSDVRLSLFVDARTADPNHTLAPDEVIVEESAVGGWRGVAVFEADLHETILGAFSALAEADIGPGQPILIARWQQDGDEAPALLRVWPSVVTKIATTVDKHGRAFSHVRFCDTVTYLGTSRVCGAFAGCSLAEAVGGAISLAANGEGAPTVAPHVGDLPALHISETLRPALATIPYVVASGESLGVLLSGLCARLGVRMEIVGHEDSVELRLKDGPPADAKIPLLLRENASATSGVLVGHLVRPEPDARDTVLDNPSSGATRRVVGRGVVGRLVTSAGTDFDESSVRAQFDSEHAFGRGEIARLVTSQPDISPGRSIYLDRAIGNSLEWQAATVLHLMQGGFYANSALLKRDGEPPRRAPPGLSGATMLTGVVNDGRTGSAAVSRDRLGRIPVSLSSDYVVSGAQAPVLALPVVDPVAGGRHGFVPQHRRGDRCRIAINHPLDVEVVGFLYDDHRGVAADVGSGSGIVVEHRGDEWSGMLFQPDDEVEEA